MSRASSFTRLLRSGFGKLRMSRLTFFQLLLLGLAFAVLWFTALRPWLESRTKVRSQALLHEAIAQFEDDFGSLDPKSYEPEPVPGEINVAHWALAGGAALLEDQGFRAELSRFFRDTQGFDVTRPAVRAGLRRNQPALDLLYRMAELERSDFGLEYAKGNRLRLPDSDQLYATGSLLGLDAVVATNDGRARDVLRSLRSLNALTGALTGEAPRPLYMLSVRLEALLERSLRRISLETPAETLGDLAELAASPTDTHGLCERFRRMAYFDAAVRVARGPDPELLRQVERSYLPKKFRRRSDIHWVGWAHVALPSLGVAVERCDAMKPLAGLGSVPQGAIVLASSQSELPYDPHALWILQPELNGHLEIARRTRHQRRMAAVALTLMVTAAERGVEPAEVTDLPLLFTDATTTELARCTEIRDLDGVATLVPIRNRSECPFWADESLHWSLEARDS